MEMPIKRSVLLAAVGMALASFAVQANATLIDLGERDLAAPLDGVPAALTFIETDQGLVTGTLQYLNNYTNIPNHPGWKNDGNVDESHFSATTIDNDVDAMISWDLGTSGFQLSYVLLKDGRDNPDMGPFVYHLYGVTSDEVFNSNGDQFVTVNGVRKITFIAFFGVPGSPAVPEGGATIVLLGLALGGIELIRRLRLRRGASA
jgi:hypothetical protein